MSADAKLLQESDLQVRTELHQLLRLASKDQLVRTLATWITAQAHHNFLSGIVAATSQLGALSPELQRPFSDFSHTTRDALFTLVMAALADRDAGALAAHLHTLVSTSGRADLEFLRAVLISVRTAIVMLAVGLD